MAQIAPRTDLGPSVRPDARGRLRSSGPGAVIVEFRTDPTNPADRTLHRGARRASTLLRLYAAGSISRPQLAAAHRLIDDLAIAHGASYREPFAASRSGACPRPDPHPRVLDAMERVRKARAALGDGLALVWWVVVFDQPLASFAGADPTRRGRATCATAEQLRLALTDLGRHYGSIR